MHPQHGSGKQAVLRHELEAMMPEAGENLLKDNRARTLSVKAEELMRGMPAMLGFSGVPGLVKILYAVMKAAPSYKRELEQALGQGATISVSQEDARASARDIIGCKIVLNLLEREAISDPLVKDAYSGVLTSDVPALQGIRACEFYGRGLASMLDWAGEDDARDAIRYLCCAEGRLWRDIQYRTKAQSAPSPSIVELAVAAASPNCPEVVELGPGTLEATLALSDSWLSGAQVTACIPHKELVTPCLMAMRALGRTARAVPFFSGRAAAKNPLVICHPSLDDLTQGMKLDDVTADALAQFEPRTSSGKARHRMDNLWLLRAMELMGESGTAAVFLPSSFTSLARFASMRSYLLESRLLSAVVSLPPGFYHGASLPMAMLVLRRNSSDVRLVNASEIKAGAGGTLDDFEAWTIRILAAGAFDCTNRLPKSITFYDESPDDFSPQGKSVIDPAKAIFIKREEDEGGESVRLGDLADVLRGPLVKPGEMDALLEPIWPTGFVPPFLYVTLGEIDGGFLRRTCDGLSSPKREWLKNKVEEGDLLISRNVNPSRMAIASLDADHSAILSSNVYALRFKDKSDALFVYSYLSSEKGREALKAAGTGTLINILSVKKLKELRIPLRDPDTKKRICNNCRQAIDTIEKSRKALEQAEESLKNSFFVPGIRDDGSLDTKSYYETEFGEEDDDGSQLD